MPPRRPIMQRSVSLLTLLVGFQALSTPLSAQDTPPDTLQSAQPAADALRVYLDCDRCDFDHIRREVPFVTYVREPEQADVHLFITDEPTGSDGRQYQLSFLGRSDFDGVEYTFEQIVDRTATSAEAREAVNEAIRLGLVPYLVQTEPLSDFSLDYSGAAREGPGQQPPDDPWKHWVFTAYVGAIELDLESNRTVFDSR